MSATASIALRIEHEGAFKTFTVSSIVIDDADHAERQVNMMKSPDLKNIAIIDFTLQLSPRLGATNKVAMGADRDRIGKLALGGQVARDVTIIRSVIRH